MRLLGRLLRGTKWEDTGHPILIPGSMATGSAILFAEEGAEASSFSVNHGSGRTMSRGNAKRTLDQKVIDQQMADADIRHFPKLTELQALRV